MTNRQAKTERERERERDGCGDGDLDGDTQTETRRHTRRHRDTATERCRDGEAKARRVRNKRRRAPGIKNIKLTWTTVCGLEPKGRQFCKERNFGKAGPMRQAQKRTQEKPAHQSTNNHGRRNKGRPERVERSYVQGAIDILGTTTGNNRQGKCRTMKIRGQRKQERQTKDALPAGRL